MNDRVAGTSVTGTSIEQPYIGNVNYWNASWDEVSALANTSTYCEQWIDYSCYKSRLLNTPSKSEPPVCACAQLTGSLITRYAVENQTGDHLAIGSVVITSAIITGEEPSERSRCADAPSTRAAPTQSFSATAMLTTDNGERREGWVCPADPGGDLTHMRCAFRYSDKGYLDFRDHLPVRKVVVGDTNRTGSEAKFSVGPLRCHGDSDFTHTCILINADFQVFKGL